MNALRMLLKQLVNRRLDGLFAALLLIGTIGFGDSASWLQPEQDGSPKALFVQPNSKPHDQGTTPKLAYLAVGNGPVVATQPFALTKLMLAKSDLKERTVGGGTGGAADAVHFDAPHQNGIALGTAAVPAGGFGATAPGRSAGAVPEPSEWALIALGLVMAGAMAYRSRKPANNVQA